MASKAETPILSMPPDRWLRWPLYLGLGIFIFVSFVTSWPVAAFTFSMLFLIWAPPFGFVVLIALGLAIWGLVRESRRRHWRSAFSIMALPILLIFSLPASKLTDNVVNHVHFLLYRQDYLSLVADSKDRQLVFIDWGGNVMIGFNRFLVFDESDEIVLPSAKRSKAFTKRLNDHGFGDSAQFRVVQTVAPHYHIVDY